VLGLSPSCLDESEGSEYHDDWQELETGSECIIDGVSEGIERGDLPQDDNDEHRQHELNNSVIQELVYLTYLCHHLMRITINKSNYHYLTVSL